MAKLFPHPLGRRWREGEKSNAFACRSARTCSVPFVHFVDTVPSAHERVTVPSADVVVRVRVPSIMAATQRMSRDTLATLFFFSLYDWEKMHYINCIIYA